MERFAQMGGVEPRRDEDILARVDREGLLCDGGDDLDAKRSALLWTRRVGGWRGGGSGRRRNSDRKLSKRRVGRRFRGQSRSFPPGRGYLGPPRNFRGRWSGDVWKGWFGFGRGRRGVCERRNHNSRGSY